TGAIVADHQNDCLIEPRIRHRRCRNEELAGERASPGSVAQVGPCAVQQCRRREEHRNQEGDVRKPSAEHRSALEDCPGGSLPKFAAPAYQASRQSGAIGLKAWVARLAKASAREAQRLVLTFGPFLPPPADLGYWKGREYRA